MAPGAPIVGNKSVVGGRSKSSDLNHRSRTDAEFSEKQNVPEYHHHHETSIAMLRFRQDTAHGLELEWNGKPFGDYQYAVGTHWAP